MNKILMKQKTEVTFEQRETVVIKRAASHLTEFCPQCRMWGEFVTPEVLAAIVDATEREIFRLVEQGTIYFVEKRRIYACQTCYEQMIAKDRRQIPQLMSKENPNASD